jgi:hypothetical protein
MFITSTHSSVHPSAGFGQSGRADETRAHGAAKARSSASEPATKVSLSDEAVQALGDELSPDEEQEVVELKARDAEVRAHENAHLAAAGGYSRGGIKYEYQRGPDNQQYAVGGHVEIDTSEVAGDPTRTIQKAETVRRAALAPGDPSGADRQVAAKASSTLRNARAELAAEKTEELADDDDDQGLAPESPLADEGPSVSARYAIAAYSRIAA